MHDIVNLESVGVPGVFVASNEFVDAAAAQARSLGATPAVVFVQHPIQDRTDEEIRTLADGAVEALLRELTAASSGGSTGDRAVPIDPPAAPDGGVRKS